MTFLFVGFLITASIGWAIVGWKYRIAKRFAAYYLVDRDKWRNEAVNLYAMNIDKQTKIGELRDIIRVTTGGWVGESNGTVH